jgi:AcrR family transcriptional regulator
MNEDTGTGLPASIEAAWGIRERPHKGPKPALSLERIVQAAVQVAETEGLGAVSMSRVATELGGATMSLYRYVAAKDELLALMVDAAYGPPPAAAGPGEGWREGLSRWAWALRAAVRRHQWTVRIPISGLPVRPNEVAWFEYALTCLRDTGLAESEKASVILMLSGYVRNIATTEADIEAAIRASGATPQEWMSSYGRMLAKLADPQRFPAIAAFVAAGVFDTADDPDDEFSFGLERVLDGIEALVRTQEPGPGSAEVPAAQPGQADRRQHQGDTRQPGQWRGGE